jgi:hypothetical protein
MAIQSTKWPKNVPTFFIPRPSKTYPNWYFSFENIPSGNPVYDWILGHPRSFFYFQTYKFLSTIAMVEYHFLLGFQSIEIRKHAACTATQIKDIYIHRDQRHIHTYIGISKQNADRIKLSFSNRSLQLCNQVSLGLLFVTKTFFSLAELLFELSMFQTNWKLEPLLSDKFDPRFCSGDNF